MVTYGLHMASPTTQMVATRVTGLMDSSGVSTKALAESTGIPRTTLVRRLTGNSAFTLEELDLIAGEFETTALALLLDEAVA